MRWTWFSLCLAACADQPTSIEVELAPSVVSSLDGTVTVRALVHDDARPLDDQPVRVSLAYVDRNGVAHDVAPIDGKTDTRGRFETTVGGLVWDGAGQVTVETSADVQATTTFVVLDRTPPQIEILPPTSDDRVGPGLPLDIQVRVADEIGVSEVIFAGAALVNGDRRTIVTSGTAMATLTFRTTVPLTMASTIDLHALAVDLSGNVGVAAKRTVTVDPAIAIATPPGLGGALLVDGTATQLDDPRALVVSAKDGKLYVADTSAGVCAGACIWRVDATTGAIDTTPIHIGLGDLEGIALDATADNLYYSDRQGRVGRLTWNGTAYATPVACNDAVQQRPQDPYHLVFDATLGLLVADGNRKALARVATCAPATVGTDFTAADAFDAPRGVALGPAGEIYVSDTGGDRIALVDRTDGTPTTFANVDAPYGIEWVGGASAWKDSLLVALSQARTVTSVQGGRDALAAAFLRNAPIDLALDGGTLYILTSPSANNRGRIYKVTGF